jgi:flagellum-specific ATP synthase
VLAARLAAQDLLDVGAYQAGTNPLVDAAVTHAGEINRFLRQDLADLTAQDEAWARLAQLVASFGVAA